jgi:hypothetical protein
MPANDCFWSDDANDITKLTNGPLCVLLQLGSQESQGCLISPIGSGGLILFAHHDIELMSEDDDL